MVLHNGTDSAKMTPPAALPFQDSPPWRSPVAAFPELDADGNPPLTDGRLVADTPGVWHVARCRSKHVKAYARDLLTLSKLTDGAVNFLLPMRHGPTVGSAGTKRRPYKSPLYPGILFVCVADDSLEIDPNHRTFPSQAITVPGRAQDTFRADLARVELMAINDPDTLDVWPGICAGQLVEIQDGHYRGLRARVEEVNPGGKRMLVVHFEDVQFSATVELGEHVRVEPI